MTSELEFAAMQRDINRLEKVVEKFDDDMRRAARMAETVVSMDVKMDTLLEVLKGSERQGDIGLVRRVEELERQTITKKSVVGLVSFIAMSWGLAAAIMTDAFHSIWK